MAFDWAQQSSALQRAMQSRGSGGFEAPWYLSTKNLQREATGTRTSGSFNPFLNPAQQGFLADNSYQTLMAKRQAEMVAQSQYGQQAGSASGSSGGMGNPSGGNWENVNKWNSQINNAISTVAQKFGVNVPANIVKAVMELESGGVNVGYNSAGYGGLMQVGPGSNVNDWNTSYAATPEGNIYYGVQELANWYKAIGTGSWEDAAAAYFSGYNYDNPGVSDGHYTVADYRAHIARNLQALNSATQGGWVNPGNGLGQNYGGGKALQTMFGGKATTPDWGAFGAESDNGLYGYGTEYGLNGTQHTGWDIPMPIGSPLYAPGPARVICSGTGNGLEGCGAFNDYIGQGAGRIELELANGVRVIYGHSSTASVRPGQYVQAGTLLGTSGGMNSPHTHLEVRVPDRNMPSGYRVVDAVQFFGGYVGGGAPAQQQSSGVLGSPSMYGWALTRALLNGRR